MQQILPGILIRNSRRNGASLGYGHDLQCTDDPRELAQRSTTASSPSGRPRTGQIAAADSYRFSQNGASGLGCRRSYRFSRKPLSGAVAKGQTRERPLGLTTTMLRFIGLVVLLGLAFGFGYLWGKSPANSLEQTMKNLSRNMMNTTLGIEQDFHRRRSLVDAKGRVIQAKAELFNKKTIEASTELGEAAISLEAITREAKQPYLETQIRDLLGKIRELRLELSLRKKVSPAKLDDIQMELDRLLRK